MQELQSYKYITLDPNWHSRHGLYYEKQHMITLRESFYSLQMLESKDVLVECVIYNGLYGTVRKVGHKPYRKQSKNIEGGDLVKVNLHETFCPTFKNATK